MSSSVIPIATPFNSGGPVSVPWANYLASLSNQVATFRTKLTAAATYYVRTDGNDTTGDGSANDAAHAFATPQGAFNYIAKNVDAAGYYVNIKIADGTYSQQTITRHDQTSGTVSAVMYLDRPIVGCAALIVEGNTATPANVIFSGNGFRIGECGGLIRLKGLTCQSDGTADQQALFCNSSGNIISIETGFTFGAFTGTSSAHMHIYGQTLLKCFFNYTISGAAFRHIWLEGAGASLDQETSTVTLTGTPAFTGAYIQVGTNCEALFISMTFTGAATGVRYIANDGATIVSPAQDLNALLPGDTNGQNTHGTVNNGLTTQYFNSGGVTNWNNGNVTLTHAAGTLTLAGGELDLAAGTTAIAPLKLQSGTNLTSAAAGAVEFDGAQLYATLDTTSGRAAVPVEQYFHLTADGSTISTIANFFGTTSNISLVASAYYIIDIYLYYLKTTAGTVTWTLTNSAAPTAQNIYYEMSPVTGIVAPPGTATMLVGQFSKDATAARTVVTGSLTTAVDHYAHFKIFLQNGTGTSLKIQATCSAGTITPRANSFWSCRRISPNNIGTFAA